MSTNVTDISQLSANRVYSYAEYLTWQFQKRVELIETFVPGANGKYQLHTIGTTDDTIRSVCFPAFEVQVEQVFTE